MTATAHSLADLQAGRLHGVQRLQLREALTSFPEAIFSLADSLEILDLSHNNLSTLPDSLPQLHRLRSLFCSYNRFTELPAILGACPQLEMIGFRANQITTVPASSLPLARLRWLILTDNAIETLHDCLANAPKLQKLMLAGNQLRSWPPQPVSLPRLELLRLSANRYLQLPEAVLSLPELRWLAYAGNPLAEFTNQSHAALPMIPWTALRIGPLLGQGASGATYRAEWQREGSMSQTVAVKLFHHDVSSDGLSVSEIEANARAGTHPHLVGALGEIDDQPQGQRGLVMPVLPDSLRVLAAPPSFQSCSRDVYAADTPLSKAQAMHIADGVAQAVRHLHACGLLHGDLYAHNVLWDDQRVVLTDLGGASPLPQAPALKQALVALDQRALATLCSELCQLAQLDQAGCRQLRQVAGLPV